MTEVVLNKSVRSARVTPGDAAVGIAFDCGTAAVSSSLATVGITLANRTITLREVPVESTSIWLSPWQTIDSVREVKP